MHHECRYEQLRQHEYISPNARLVHRIKSLEAELASLRNVDSGPTDLAEMVSPPLPVLAPALDSPSDVMVCEDPMAEDANQVIDDEITVDDLATATFDERQESNVGFFGALSLLVVCTKRIR